MESLAVLLILAEAGLRDWSFFVARCATDDFSDEPGMLFGGHGLKAM